jgi:tetratricopeptide (TPR) repeat protein
LHDNRSKVTLSEIGADFDNIRVVWNYWVDKRNAQRILEFVSALWFFFEVRGSYIPAIQFFGNAAEKLSTSEPDIVWAQAQLKARQAWFTALIGLPDEGLRIVQESLQILRQINKDEITVETLHCANINAIFLNKGKLVAQICQQMQERAERSGDIWEQGFALIWSAWSLFMQHQLDEATKPGQEALAIFEKLGDPFGASVASGVILASVAMATGDIGAAKAYCLRGMQAAEEINYRRLLQRTYDGLGTASLLELDFQQARQYFIKSLQISQECGQTREMLSSLLDLASVHLAQGNLNDALGFTAIVLNHPASDQNSLNRPGFLRDDAEKLRAQIETRLDHAHFQSAWESGQKQKLADVVTQILN